MRQGIFPIFVLTGSLLVTTLIGCSTRRSGNSPDNSSVLIGRWRQTSIATAKQSVNCPGTLRLPGGSTTSCSGKDEIEFNANGTFTATFSGSPVKGSGTWRLNGNTLFLAFVAPANVAGKTQSTTIRFVDGGKTINIDAKLGDTPTTETYIRQ
jgi:Lipocalin-like domain